jgi:hypothetical protein
MSHRRLTSLALLVATIALLALPAVAGATREPAPTVTVEYVPFSFVMTPAQCKQLETTITGAGQYVITNTTQKLRNGSTLFTSEALANDLATDSEGHTYRFDYGNTFTATIPPGAPYPPVARQTDFFRLVGTGSANGLSVDWEAILTFTGPNQPPSRFAFVSLHGDPNCDPI